MVAREVVVDRTALLKIVLHAAKYPCGAVNGVLLGTVAAAAAAPGASPPGSPRGAAGGAAVHVYDAVPLCHNFISLTPVLECALTQVGGQRGGGRRGRPRSAKQPCPSRAGAAFSDSP